jgi:uncharacterized protein (TIGR03083 family)
LSSPLTKQQILAELRTARADWDELIASMDEAQLTEPGAAGEWSVKDVIAHLTSYDRWFVNTSEAYFRGVPPPPDGAEGMDMDARNQFHHRLTQDQPLAEALTDSRQTFARLLEFVEAHSEEFLAQPQRFGYPHEIEVSDLLRADGYGHYREHAQGIREWLAARAAAD